MEVCTELVKMLGRKLIFAAALNIDVKGTSICLPERRMSQ